MSMNSVNITGRLARDPEKRMTQSQLSVTSFTIAVDGKKDDVSFFDCVAWRSTADLVAEYCHKGEKVGITGHLQARSYEDRNGNKRKVVEIVADSVEFLTSKKEKNESPFSDLPDEADDDFPF